MLLLDTCSLIWLTNFQNYLPKQVITEIEKYSGNLYVSAISAFEIAIKNSKGLLELPLSPLMWFDNTVKMHGLTELPVDYKIYIESVELPKIHQDPVDRIIIATAKEHNLKIITPDKRIRQYDCIKTIW